MFIRRLQFGILSAYALFFLFKTILGQIDLRQIHSFGCEITGISIENQVSNEDFDLIHEALLFCKVLVIRDQSNLSVEKQRTFSKRFGKLHVHLESASHYQGYEDVNCVSNMKDENGKYIGLYGRHVEEFHSDLSWAPIPSKITIVKVQVRPTGCGDTEFLDSSAAYDMLSEEMKELLRGLRAEYCYLKHRLPDDEGRSPPAESVGSTTLTSLSDEEQRQAAKCAVHPVVTTHPITGQQNLFANPSHTAHLLAHDLAAKNTSLTSAELLQQLFDTMASAPQLRYRHVWQDGDVVLWDNRAVQHRATGCPDSLPRLLVRTTVEGDAAPEERGAVAVVSASDGVDLLADRAFATS